MASRGLSLRHRTFQQVHEERWRGIQPGRLQISQPAEDVIVHRAIGVGDASAEKERREQHPFKRLPVVEWGGAKRTVVWRKVKPRFSLVGRDDKVAMRHGHQLRFARGGRSSQNDRRDRPAA